MKLLLGLDYGTTSFKAGLFDAAGRAAALAGGELVVRRPAPGWVEQDADASWRAVCGAVRRVLADAGTPPESVAAVAVTGSSHLTLLDEAGRVLRPAILYGDTRLPLPAEVEAIVRALGPERVASAFGLTELDEARLGIILRVMRSAKLLWLRAHEPEVFNRVRACLSSSADYVNYRLAGTLTRLAGEPALDDDIAALFELPAAWFGKTYPTGEVLGCVSPRASDETSLAAGTPVVMTSIDSLAAFLGTGLARPGLVANLAGTTDVVGVTLDRRPRDGAGYALAHLIPGLWLLSLAPERGPALRWFRDLFLPSGAGYEAIDALAAKAAPGAAGLLCLPYLAGEKGVIHDPQARGVLVGLDTHHSVEHVARALLEGVACGLREILDAYQAAGATIEAVRLSGGGARSRLWNQIKADMLGRPVEVMETHEAGCLGCAMLAAAAVGLHADRAQASQSMARIAETLEPSLLVVETYRELFGLYRQVYPANRTVLAGLARWRG